MKVVVVGAGPAGLITALRLVKEHDVTVYEKNKSVKSTPCSGGISLNSLRSLKADTGFESDPYILKRIKGFKLVYPNNTAGYIPTEGAILDREEWQKALSEEVESNGGDLVLGKKVKPHELDAEYDVVVGADGPFSVVREAIGGEVEHRKLYYKEIQYNTDDLSYAYFYVDKNLSPYYIWLFPRGDTVSVGGHDKQGLEQFVEETGVKGETLREGSWVDSIGGTVYENERGNTYLIGDAASTTNPFTSGGLGPIVHSSKLLANAIKTRTSYEKMVRKKIVVNNDLKAKKVAEQLNNYQLNLVGEAINGRNILKPKAGLIKLLRPTIIAKIRSLQKAFKHCVKIW